MKHHVGTPVNSDDQPMPEVKTLKRDDCEELEKQFLLLTEFAELQHILYCNTLTFLKCKLPLR